MDLGHARPHPASWEVPNSVSAHQGCPARRPSRTWHAAPPHAESTGRTDRRTLILPSTTFNLANPENELGMGDGSRFLGNADFRVHLCVF